MLKTLYPWRIPSSKQFTPEEFQAQIPLPHEEFHAQNLLPVKNSKLKTFHTWRIPCSKHCTPEEFQAQILLTLKNSMLKTLSLHEKLDLPL
jgi:hypothetical protein